MKKVLTRIRSEKRTRPFSGSSPILRPLLGGICGVGTPFILRGNARFDREICEKDGKKWVFVKIKKISHLPAGRGGGDQRSEMR